MRVVLIFLVLSTAVVFADVKDLEKKFNSCTKENSDALILEAAHWADARVKGLSAKEIEALFYKETFESEVITRFGSQYLPKTTRLSLGAKACGSYMDRYVESLKNKNPKAAEIKFWTLCIENDYRNQIPKIAQTLINCRK